MQIKGMRGVTLLELLFVIGIMAVIMGFASVGTEMIRKERVAGAARELYADLQSARLNAMTQGGKGYGIRLESANSYVIFKFDDCNDDYNYDKDTCGGMREERDVVRKTLHPSIELHRTNTSTQVNNDVRIFDRFGTPRQANWGMGMITIVVDNVSDSGQVKCISISTNRIRESVWNGSECV